MPLIKKHQITVTPPRFSSLHHKSSSSNPANKWETGMLKKSYCRSYIRQPTVPVIGIRKPTPLHFQKSARENRLTWNARKFTYVICLVVGLKNTRCHLKGRKKEKEKYCDLL